MTEATRARTEAPAGGVGLGFSGLSIRDPKKHISISFLWGYPYLIGLHYRGVYMGYPHPYFFIYVLLWGPSLGCYGVRVLGFMGFRV